MDLICTVIYTRLSSKEREERRGRLEYSAKIPPGHKSAISRCVCSTSCKHTHTHTDSLNLLEREHGKRDDFFVLFFEKEGGYRERKRFYINEQSTLIQDKT